MALHATVCGVAVWVGGDEWLSLNFKAVRALLIAIMGLSCVCVCRWAGHRNKSMGLGLQVKGVLHTCAVGRRRCTVLYVRWGLGWVQGLPVQ